MPIPRLLFLCSLVVAFDCLAQSPDSIKDPGALYATVARSYDYTSSTTQPWQLTATYQTFDPGGKPAEQGTYHYWWLSPAVYRSTWTRGSAVQSEWMTAEGKKLQTTSGGPIHLFEINLIRELLSPLPDPEDPAFSDTYFERDTRTFGIVKTPCVKIVGKRSPHHSTPFPYAPPVDRVESMFCFDPKLPVVVFGSSVMGNTTYAYSDFVRTQVRFLPRSFVESINGRTLLKVSVESVASLNPGDPALVPPADAKPDTDAPVHLTRNDVISHRIKGSAEFSGIENRDGIAGTVVIEFIITKDGHVRDPEPISSPDPSHTAAAISLISRWVFKPWLINGQPVEVRTAYGLTY